MGFKHRPLGWAKTSRRIIQRDRGICWICRQPGADSTDHVVPRSKGGGHDDANLRAAHLSCNSQRQDRDLPGTPIRRRVKVILPRARPSRWH